MLLQAKIDPDAIQNIQKEINRISKNTDAIKIDIKVNDNVLKDIKSLNKEIEGAIGKTSKTVNISGDFDRMKVHMDAVGNVKKVVTDITEEYGKQLQITQKMDEEQKKLTTTGQKLTINKEKQLKVDEQIQNAIAKTIRLREEENRKLEEKQSKASNKYLDDEYKRNQKIKERIELFQKEQEIKIRSAESRYGSLLDHNAIAKYRAELNKLSADMDNPERKIKEMRIELRGLEVEAQNNKRALDLANKSAMSFGEALKTAAYKFGIWSAVTASYYKLIREIRNGIKFVNEMDAALTEIGMVTNQTREQTAKLAQEYNSLAREMKVLTSEVAAGAVEFYRQGLSQEEVMERLRVNTMYSKIANIDFKESAELLTATVNSMGLEIEHASDVFLYLGDSTATSGAEIAKGFQKVGGSASALGLEFERVAAWIAVISARTRESAESIGHSIATMLSRMSRITTTGFNEDDDTKINDVAKALDSVGIALTDTGGNYRDFGIILDEVHDKWEGMSDQQKAYIANVIAGTRQQSRFYNLMDGYAESMRLYEESLEAAGTTQSKFQLYLESNQATLDRFRVAVEKLWISIIDSDALMSLVRGATSLIEVLDSMVNKFGALQSIMAVIIPIIGVKYVASVSAATKATISQELAMAGITSSSIGLANGFKLLIGQLLGVKTAATGATISFLGLNAAALLVGGALVAIPLLLMKIAKNARESEEALNNALDNSQKLHDEVGLLEQLIKKQEELNKIEDKTAEQKEELLRVQRELAQLYPELATGIDEEGNKIAENIDLTKELTEEKKKLLEQQLLAIKTTADSELPKLRQELADMQKEAEEIQRRLSEGDTKETETHGGYQVSIDKTKELKDRLLELVDAQGETMNQIRQYESALASYNKITDERIENENKLRVVQLQKQAQNARSIQQLEGIEKQLKDMGYTSKETAQIMQGSDIDTIRTQKDLKAAIENTDNALSQTPKTLEDYTEEFDELTSELQEYYKILDELNSKEGLSAKSKQEMITKHQELLPYISDEQELRRQLIQIIQQEEEAQRTAYANMLMVSEEFYNVKIKGNKELAEKLSEYYGIDLENYKSLAEAKEAVETALIQTLSDKWQKYFNVTGLGIKETMDNLARAALHGDSYAAKMADELYPAYKKIMETEQAFRDLALDLGGIDFKGINMGKIKDPKKGKEKKDKKDNRQFLDSIDAEIRAIQSRNDHLEKTADLLQEQLNLAREIEGVEGLSKQYELTGQIIEHNTKLLQSYKDEQDAIHKKANDIRKQYSKYNIDSWFDANAEQTVAYINQYNKATKEQQEEMQKVFSQVQKLKQAWMGANDAVKNVLQTNKELTRELENHPDKVRSYVRELIEAEKRNVYLELEMRQRRANEELKQARQQMESEVEYYQSRIKSIQNEIDWIQESERARQESLERAKRLEEIAELQNRYYTLQYKSLSSLTEEQAKALGLEREREQYLERQAKIQELLVKLENTRKEKNIQQLTKQQDGTWQFEYVADEREIDNINKQIEDLQKEHSKTLKDLKERTLDDLKRAQEEYDEWERQNRIRRQIEEKQRRIQEYQDEITDLQNKFAEKERLTNEAFEREKENLDRFYTDIDLLTDEKMEELYKTFDGNWSSIHGMLTGYFRSIASEYEALIATLSQPLPDPGGGGGSGGGDYGYYEAPSGGTSFIRGGSSGGSSSKTDWSAMYMDARSKGDWQTMEYANRQANIERGLGDVVTSDKDIESIKRKYGGSYHTGGVVGDGSRDLPEAVNRLFNTKADEQMVKAKIGELFVPKENLAKYFVPNMQELVKSAVLSTVNLVTPKVPNVALAGAGGGDIKQNINIDKLEFPNVKDAREIEGAIKSLSTYANQWANRK